jgi:hypothetical protein
MGNTTSAHIIIYSCPPEQAEATTAAEVTPTAPAVTITDAYHEGPVVAREWAGVGGMLILCPLGHVVKGLQSKSWGDSPEAVRLTWHQAAMRSDDADFRARHLWTVRCEGATSAEPPAETVVAP